MNFTEYEKLAKELLSPKRFKHTMGTVETAVRLAEFYGEDENKAKTAAVLHDITKEFNDERQLQLISEFGIMLNNVERAEPKLYHAVSGALYVKNILKLDDEDIYNAIYYHTTAREGMSLLEKIIYVADFIEPNRDFEGVEHLRSVVFDGIDQCLIECLKCSVTEVMGKGSGIHINTINAYNELILKQKGRKINA